MKCLAGIGALIFYSLLASGQPVVFEKGYLIDQSGDKMTCYIQLEDWNALRSVHYRVSLKDFVATKEIGGVKEFGVKGSKYISTKTKLDISGDEESLLSYDQNPEWQEELIFLRVLVEGKINLYAFEERKMTRYFFSDENAPPEQLVFKKYRTTTGVQTNLTYQNTLFNRLNCMDSSERYFKAIKYTSSDLTKTFETINNCEGATATIYEVPETPVEESKTMEFAEVKKRTSSVDMNKEKSTAQTDQYFGVVANPLFRQLFNLAGNNNAIGTPYGLQYAINSKENGKGMNMGLSYDRNSFTDNSGGVTRETINRNISFRIGYDRKRDLGKRWIGIFGFDFLLDGTRSQTTSTPAAGLTIETSTKGWGIGPRFGLMFRLSDRVLLGTDATSYLKFVNSNQLFPDQPQSKSHQKSTNFNITLPVALFLTVKLKE